MSTRLRVEQLYSRAIVFEARAVEIEREMEDRVSAVPADLRLSVRNELHRQILANRKLAEENREAAEQWGELVETFILKMRTRA